MVPAKSTAPAHAGRMTRPVLVSPPACNAGLRPNCASSFTHPILLCGVKRYHDCIRAAVSNTATLSKVDINSGYNLSKSDIEFYREQGFVKLPRVFNEDTLAHYGPAMSVEVRQADDAPLQEDAAYQQAFKQVEGVRLYADQALYKEPHGGFTPWHCDATNWPLASDKAVTAWIPLQATPQEMGPMQFLAGSHKHDLGRSLDISGKSHKLIDANVQQSGLDLVKKPFQLGDVSFHSSLVFHKTDGNETEKPREVFTIIFIDKDMKLSELSTVYHRRDRDENFPGVQPGQVCDTALNPVLWSHDWVEE